MDSAGNGMHAFAIGLEGAKIDDMWKLIDVDFSSILSSPCKIISNYISLYIYLYQVIHMTIC